MASRRTSRLGGQNVGPLAGSLDIVAHELTHGVTSSSSNLLRLNEPGALNEAFSDMMGTSVEFFFQVPGAGIGQADYLIGEDSFRTPGGGLNGIRSLVNPIAFGYPRSLQHQVHRPGRQRRSAHQLDDPVSRVLSLHRGRPESRLRYHRSRRRSSQSRADREVLLSRVHASSFLHPPTFSTARAATIQAARDLYGANSAAATAITQAWTAVGVN